MDTSTDAPAKESFAEQDDALPYKSAASAFEYSGDEQEEDLEEQKVDGEEISVDETQRAPAKESFVEQRDVAPFKSVAEDGVIHSDDEEKSMGENGVIYSDDEEEEYSDQESIDETQSDDESKPVSHEISVHDDKGLKPSSLTVAPVKQDVATPVTQASGTEVARGGDANTSSTRNSEAGSATGGKDGSCFSKKGKPKQSSTGDKNKVRVCAKAWSWVTQANSLHTHTHIRARAHTPGPSDGEGDQGEEEGRRKGVCVY